MQPLFSIIVVCLNPGEKLRYTLESIKKQKFQEYEVLVKDGGSTDGSLTWIDTVFPKESFGCEGKLPKVSLVQEKDTGIYDAMNKAAAKVEGRYVYFLNCGDLFYDENVLREMAGFISGSSAFMTSEPGIYYGNIFERLTGQQVASNPRIDAFGCYRNVPCHQACFYSRELLAMHPFETKYKVRADYEQFLWCFFVGPSGKKMVFAYKDMLIADYEGGGFSETKENRKRSAKEHKEITEKYMSSGQLLKYRLILLVTLAPLRTWLAENEKTAGFYNTLKERIYSARN